MSTDRRLHLLRRPAASPDPADCRGPRRPHGLRFPQAGAGTPRASVACSATSGGRYIFEDGDCIVTSTEGVGTKLKLAFETGIHDTIGIDLVATSVNDIVTSGARPLSFQDYYATNKLDVDLAEKVIKGIVDGCQQSDCPFEQGEEINQTLIGLPSSGFHSNGFSLARRVLEKSGFSLSDQLRRNDGITSTIGEALMALTAIYVKQVLEIICNGGVKGLTHITGGGLSENIPRVLPSGLGAKIITGSWEVPPVLKWLQQVGNIDDEEMWRTFNMGIGMVLVVSAESADRIIQDTHGSNPAYRIGEVIKGKGVHYV